MNAKRVEKTNAAGRLNAELGAATAADERQRAAGMQAAKAAEKRRDLFHA